jgi:uncharacterized membrane protein
MSKVEDFLTKDEEAEIVEAIRMAEKNTSGEIRIHLEKLTDIAPIERAMSVFHELKMDQTQLRNGVIIYVAVKSKQFAIFGDIGINEKVTDDFWNSTKNIMVNYFKNGANKQALIEGIRSAGEQLKQHFPFEDGDIDELTNEISRG